MAFIRGRIHCTWEFFGARLPTMRGTRSPVLQTLGKVDWMTSRFGVGNSKFHYGGKEGPTDTVYLGVYDTRAFR